MKNTTQSTLRTLAALSAVVCLQALSFAGDANVIDTFDDVTNNSHGIPRAFADDTATGGQTTTTQTVKDGVLVNEGSIVPPRGQPGWASMVFILNPDGAPADLSQYEGVSLKIRQHSGMLSVSANSTEIDNFDYHAAMVPYQKSGDFEEIRIPFASMKRAWSGQTQLNKETIASISLVSIGMQKSDFAYEIDEISFY